MINYNTLVFILKKLNTDITIEKLSEDLDCSESTCNRLLNLDKPYKRPPTSLKYDKYMSTFKEYKKRYFGNNPSKIIEAIIGILNEISIDITAVNEQFAFYNETSNINEESFEQFIILLIHQASLFYSSTPQTQHQTANLQDINCYKAENIIEMKTYFDLQHYGLTALDIAKQLIANDQALYGDIGNHAGSAEQWAQHIRTTPENWCFLCRGTKIIGNWSCTFLTNDQEASIRAGSMLGSAFTADQATNPLTSADGEVAVHLLNISVNEGYQSETHWSMLWTSFGERLHQLAKKGVFYRSISTCIFLSDYKPIFENMGFKYLTSRVGRGDIYWLDLTYEFPEAFRKIMPNTRLDLLYEEYWGKTITFRQLSSNDVLSRQQKLDISTLIFSSDRYVYDAMMTREQAKRILPLVFAGKKDAMFSLNNLFVAMTDDRIVGLILSKKGKLNWSSKNFKKAAEFLGEKLPDSLDIVEKEYFTLYDLENTRSVINFCINSNWCRWDINVGLNLMSAFVNTYRHDNMRLYVLRETLREMQVYLGNGFEIEELCNGWSIDKRDLPCALLVRSADITA